MIQSHHAEALSERQLETLWETKTDAVVIHAGDWGMKSNTSQNACPGATTRADPMADMRPC
jgi:hypothetical protein